MAVVVAVVEEAERSASMRRRWQMGHRIVNRQQAKGISPLDGAVRKISDERGAQRQAVWSSGQFSLNTS